MAKTKTREPGLILNYEQAAEYLGIPVKTLRTWVHEKRIPITRLSPGGAERKGRVYFNRRALDRWLEEKTDTNGDAA